MSQWPQVPMASLISIFSNSKHLVARLFDISGLSIRSIHSDGNERVDHARSFCHPDLHNSDVAILVISLQWATLWWWFCWRHSCIKCFAGILFIVCISFLSLLYVSDIYRLFLRGTFLSWTNFCNIAMSYKSLLFRLFFQFLRIVKVFLYILPNLYKYDLNIKIYIYWRYKQRTCVYN